MIVFRPRPKNDKEAMVVLLTSMQKDLRLKKELEKGEMFPILDGKKTILFVGLGKAEKLSLTDLRIQVRKVFLSGFLKKIRDVELVPHTGNEASIKAIIGTGWKISGQSGWKGAKIQLRMPL